MLNFSPIMLLSNAQYNYYAYDSKMTTAVKPQLVCFNYVYNYLIISLVIALYDVHMQLRHSYNVYDVNVKKL